MSFSRRSFLAGAIALTASAPAGAIAFSKPSSTDEIIKRLKRYGYIHNETLYLDKTLEVPDGSEIKNCIIRKTKDFKGSSMITAKINSKWSMTGCHLHTSNEYGFSNSTDESQIAQLANQKFRDLVFAQ